MSTTTTSPLQEVVNPASVGWRWSNTYEGFKGIYQHEVCWIRGTDLLLYGTKAPTNREWTITPITRPERLGFDSTLVGARKAAEAFYAGEGKE